MPGATAEPPAAPPPVAAPPPAATPKDLTVPAPSDPPRVGSARERMLKETSGKWGEDAKVPETVKPPKPAEAAARPGEELAAEPATPPPDLSPEQKKQNPWKLYRAEKERAATLERQIAEAKTSGLAETEKSQYLERIEKTEAKLRTYEDEIRFKAYEKSEEFQTKYETPYNQAWQKHMDDLRGVTITGEDGVARPMEAKDILDLVNLELADARDLADSKWGKFAGDAMTARKEIRDLFHARSKALEEARKRGADWEKQMGERTQRWQKEVNAHITATWNAANQEALEHPVNGEFFKVVEGDPKRNEIRAKGYAQADKAFAINVMNPNLTPEQRAEGVKLHAVIRNRSAGFGVVKYLYRRAMERIAELEKANAKYKESEPSTAGGVQTAATGQPLSGRAKMLAAQERFARG